MVASSTKGCYLVHYTIFIYMRDVTVYLIKTLYFRVVMFFRRWYVNGFFVVYDMVQSLFGRLERKFALRANAHFLFKPLYQEYNVIGYVIGFVYRAFTLLFGGLLYASIALGGVAVFGMWAAIPIYGIYRIIIG